MNILFTDLDNTLIYSKDMKPEKKILVEIYNDKANSFMSEFSYQLIKRLEEKLLLIPVTTRSIVQYRRINLGISPKYTLCANGGILLKYGLIDREWYKDTLLMTEDSYEERQKALRYLENDTRRTFECRNVEDLFVFTKCENAEEAARDLMHLLNCELVNVLYNKDKLYILPKKLNKADMAKKFTEKLSNKEFNRNKDLIFAAGDTDFDLDMVKSADIGFAHKDMVIDNSDKNILNRYSGLFSDFYLKEILNQIVK